MKESKKYHLKHELLNFPRGQEILDLYNKSKIIPRKISVLKAKVYYFFSRKDLLFPDFMVIGSQKCGTTWLYQMLKKHPQIFVPSVKEVHFYDAFYSFGYKWYSYFFELGRKKLKGDLTPAYCVLEEKYIKEIVKKNPSIKIILMVRNPIDRAWSSFLMEKIRFFGKTFEESSKEEIEKHLSSNWSKSLGDYLLMVKRWSKYLSENQFQIVFYDEISENPQKFLNRVTDFLNVKKMSFAETELKKKYNENKKIKIPPEYLKILIRAYKEKITDQDKFFKNKYTKRWVKTLEHENL